LLDNYTAGTAKTLFLEAVGDNVKDACFITNNATGPGILNVLYEKPDLRFLCIDEIEKIPRDQLAVLLTLMESGKFIITKKTMMVNRDQKVTIFATCNKVKRLAPEIRSRFLKFHLKEYNFSEFNMITRNLAINRFNQSIEFAEKIADSVWNKMNSKDIRDCVKIMKLCKNIDQIDIIIEGLNEYGKNKDE
jgi:Holliday junction DNA helicase RuvB